MIEELFCIVPHFTRWLEHLPESVGPLASWGTNLLSLQLEHSDGLL